MPPSPRQRDSARCFVLAALGLAFLLAEFCARAATVTGPIQHSPNEVLLIINTNSAVSQAVGAYYQQKRGITNVLDVQCEDSAVSSANETIDIADYTAQLATPISTYLAGHTGINFIVLTKGIPLRVSGGTTGSVQLGNPAQPSLDSYLAALNYSKVRGARQASIAESAAEGGAKGKAWINRYYNTDAPFSHAKYGGYLVTRLDGYTQADAMAVVDRALAAEAGISQGPILLDIEPDFGVGTPSSQPTARAAERVLNDEPQSVLNSDMVHIGSILQASGIPNNTNITRAYPGNQVNLLGFFSFASDDDNFDSNAYESLQFAPGAIGVTYVSTCARTLLPTNDGGQSLIADLIAHGITGVEGDVNEPLWYTMSSPSINLAHYLTGYTLAESFSAGDKYLGWENLIVGDPLCCPYFNAPNTLLTLKAATSHFGIVRGAKNVASVEGGSYVSGLSVGSDLLYYRINLTGIQSFITRVASADSSAHTIELHLDHPTGTLVGTCLVLPTGNAQAWTNVSASLTPTSGDHNVYLVFPSGGVNVEWLSFRPEALPKQLVPGATISLQSMTNGAFVEPQGQTLVANANSVGSSQQFLVVDAGNGNIALQSQATGQYVTADPTGVAPLSASGGSVGSAQTFTEDDLGGSNVALVSAADNLFVTVEVNNSGELFNQAMSVTADETFTILTY
jgi:uncharacterized protein (TIGR03790 family)